MNENMIVCNKCGNMVSSQQKFCPSCGNQIQAATGPAPNTYGQQVPPQGQNQYNQQVPPQGQNQYNQQVPPQGQNQYNQQVPPQGQNQYGQQQSYQNQNQYGQQAPPPYGQQQYYPNQKSKIVAGILGIILGHLGIHNFYLGNTSRAVTQLVLSIVGYCTVIFVVGGFLIAIAAIWGLVEGIQCLTGSISKDANGVPLKD